MKADFLAGRIGGRGKERAEFPVDVAQSNAVFFIQKNIPQAVAGLWGGLCASLLA
jgi:hypothetical protein